MKTLPRDEALEYWKTYWSKMSVEFFKVEALQSYNAEEALQSPSYRLWSEGDRSGSIELMRNGGTTIAKQSDDKHILKRRIHIVERPYSSYLEWEIMHYKLVNIPMRGDRVFLVAADSIRDLVIPGDFMIFDDEWVANSHYDKNGIMTGMDFYDKGEDISQFLKLKQLLLAQATELKVDLKTSMLNRSVGAMGY